MAIIYDSTANSTGTGVSSLTYALNNSAGDVLVVGVCVNDGAASHVSGITYNGVALTKSVENNDDSPGSQTSTSLWYLASPATGSHNVVVSLNGTYNVSSGAITFSGSNTSSPIGATTTKKQANGTSNTVSITTSYANSILVDVWGMSGTATSVSATGTNQTSRWVNSTSRTAMGSTETTTTAGSYTMSWSWTTSRISGGCVAEVRELSTVAYTLTAGTGSFDLTSVATAITSARKLLCSTGNYTLTSINTILSRGFKMIMGVSSYILTGIDATLTFFGWTHDSKPTTPWTNDTEPSTSFTNDTKPSTNWTNDSK